MGLFLSAFGTFWGVRTTFKKERQINIDKTEELIALKADKDDFEEYKETHRAYHVELKEDISKKASNEKVDMILLLMEKQQKQIDKVASNTDEILKRI